MKIDNKLASEVLDLTIYGMDINDSSITITFDALGEVRKYDLDLYRFAAMCKLWSAKQGYSLYSNESECKAVDVKTNESYGEFIADREPIAIILAATWVYERLNN